MHQSYLLFSVSPSQRRPPEIVRARSDPVKLFFGGFFVFHLIVLFQFLIFLLPDLLGSELINTDFFNVLNGFFGVF